MTILNAAGEATRPAIRVAVSIPAGEEVKTSFAYDLASMVGTTIAADIGIDIRVHIVKETILPKGRQNLVRMAMESGCTHMLWLDSDMRFPRNTLVRLLSHGLPIVGANYVNRRMPTIRPVTFRDHADPTLRVFTEPGVDGLEQVASVGFGCVLIDTDVFRAMELPWFHFEWDPEKDWFLGEDVYFCRKAQALGLNIVIDHGLSQEVKHIGEWEFSHEHALALRSESAEPAVPAMA